MSSSSHILLQSGQGSSGSLLRSLVLGAQAWALIGQLFYISCLVPVAFNAYGWLPIEWSPHYWSPFFGSPGFIFTHGVRGFWGKYWHQTMRISVSGPGFTLADALRLKRNGLARYTLLCAVAFGLSGTIHFGLVPPEPLHATIDPNSIRLYIAGFFWVQPIAMLVELFVAQTVARTLGIQYWQHGAGLKVRMVVNGIWVVAWFALVLPMLGEASRQLGYWRIWPMPD
ncbi:hypothetical protein LTR08_000781 [Meristemomyces frigidus]|nr:hypothetical protein LTR08_000781 [Meristemomyces frigidus]